MKNRILVLCLVLAGMVGTGMAQMKALKTAKRYLTQEKYSEAAGLIDQVVANPETANMLDAWITRGKVYLAISRNPLLVRDFSNAADLSKESFEKALQIDPSDKTRLLVRNDLNGLAGVFYDNGANKFEEGAFAVAVAEFEKSLQMNKLEGIYDTNCAFNVALCASNANMLDKAIEYYKVLVDAGYPLSSAYVGLADAYFRNGQKEDAARVIEEAVARFPEEKSVYISASSVYLRMGANEKASGLLNTALAKWGDDASFQLFIGIAYENDKQYDKAEAAYLKALELKPDYAEAIYNTGAFYVNKGIRLKDEANALPLEEEAKYEELEAQSKDVFNKALPYLQKVIEAQPRNVNVMMTLRDVYMQLGQADKAKEWSEKIQALEGAAE